MSKFDNDVVIIGSGFAGSVSAQVERAMSMWPNRGELDTRPDVDEPYQRVDPVAPKAPLGPAAALRLPIVGASDPPQLKLAAKRNHEPSEARPIAWAKPSSDEVAGARSAATCAMHRARPGGRSRAGLCMCHVEQHTDLTGGSC